jgi:hypothetical protein
MKIVEFIDIVFGNLILFPIAFRWVFACRMLSVLSILPVVLTGVK